VALHHQHIGKRAERELILERVTHPRTLVGALELVHVPHATESSAHHLVGETMRRVELGDTHAQTLTHGEVRGFANAESALSTTARSRFRGAFLGCLLGDAVGRPFEMMSASDGRIGGSSSWTPS